MNTPTKQDKVIKHLDKMTKHVGFDVHKEATKLWAQMIKQNEARELNQRKMPRLGAMPTIVVHQCNRFGSSGLCYYGQWKITLSLGLDTVRNWETLAHELNHAAGFRGHDRAFYHSLKAIVEKRWKTRISFYEVTRYGYDVDQRIVGQLDTSGCVNFESKKVKA